MTHLAALALTLAFPASAEPPAAAKAPQPAWMCARPAFKSCGKGEECPSPPQEMSGPRDYGLEIKCLVEWLDEFSGGKADPAAYERERARARLVLKKLSAWAKAAPAMKKP